jgi:adenosylhomocysteinase
MPVSRAAPLGDFFCTLTGDINVIRAEHFATMKDGAIVSNSGHFDVELDLPGLTEASVNRRLIREFVEEFSLKNGRRVYVLSEGRLINLSAAEGHPSSVMDMSFANQALSAEYMAIEHDKMDKRVYPVPKDIDKEIARLKLQSMGIEIDTLTPEQEKYLSSWEMGT